MVYVPMADLLDKTGSVYKLVILAAKRAVELNKGAGRLVECLSSNEKLSTVAMKEIAEGKISFRQPVEKEKK